MATYSELDTLFSTNTLRDKVRVAIGIAAFNVTEESPATANHAERLKWAAKALANPSGELARFMVGVLAANKTASVATINGATDTAIQTNVDALVDTFAIADFGV